MYSRRHQLSSAVHIGSPEADRGYDPGGYRRGQKRIRRQMDPLSVREPAESETETAGLWRIRKRLNKRFGGAYR